MGKRVQGTGTIKQRKNGTWEGQYYFEGKRKSIYAKTQAEVRLKLNSIISNIIKEEHFEIGKMTLAEWLNIWLQKYGKPSIRHSTYLSYEGYCKNHIIPIIGKIQMKNINGEILQQFFNEKAQSGRQDKKEHGLSPKSLQNMRNMLNLIFRQAVINKVMRHNPIQEIRLPRVQRKEMRALSGQEQYAVEQTIYSKKDNALDYGVIIALYTGLRLGELLGLQWQDIDLEFTKCLYVRRILIRQATPDENDTNYEILRHSNKTSLMLGRVKSDTGYRKIYLPNKAINAIKKLREYQIIKADEYGEGFNPRNFVICNEIGEPIEQRTYTDIYHRITTAAGIPHASFHALRHTFATRAMEMSMDVKTLSETLGHAQASTTLNMYAHSQDEQKKREMAKFNMDNVGTMAENY